MLANFKKRFLDSQTNVQRQWDIAMAETAHVPGCTCTFCARHLEIDDTDATSSLPSTRSIIQVLYPPSYLGITSPFPDPPSYSPTDPPSYPARGDDAEISPMMTSTTAGNQRTPLSRSPPDPLAQDPSLTGVPSQGTPRRVLPVEPNPPSIALDGDVLEETEPLPAYSRSDQRRPRFPVASDVLGPYPPLSVLGGTAR